MTAYDLSDRMAKIHRAIEAVTELKLMDGIHGLDRELLAEELTELHLAAHDTCREFEEQCKAQGKAELSRLLIKSGQVV